jgi:hypothetical protein
MNIHDWGNLEIKGTISLNKIFIPCNLSVHDTQSMNHVKKSHLLCWNLLLIGSYSKIYVVSEQQQFHPSKTA